MRERWSPPPEEMKRDAPDVWEKPKSLRDTIDKARELARRLRIISEDPEVQTGASATARTLINGSIAIADTIPAFGMVASYGADAAKIWSRVDYLRRCKSAVEQGKNPLAVKKLPIDLTPDVGILLATLTEIPDLAMGDAFPSHAIEGGRQLVSYDIPRMRTAFSRLREHLRDISREADSAELVTAATAFNVKIK